VTRLGCPCRCSLRRLGTTRMRWSRCMSSMRAWRTRVSRTPSREPVHVCLLIIGGGVR
jgi:hypothetical protein